MAGKICCVIGKIALTKKDVKKAKKILLATFEYLIENSCNHFIVGVTTEVDVLAAKIISSLKDKNPDVILEVEAQNQDMIFSAPKEIKSLLLDRKFDLVYVEQKKHNSSKEKESYKCIIERSDVVVIVLTGNVNSDIDRKFTYANAQEPNKTIFTFLV